MFNLNNKIKEYSKYWIRHLQIMDDYQTTKKCLAVLSQWKQNKWNL